MLNQVKHCARSFAFHAPWAPEADRDRVSHTRKRNQLPSRDAYDIMQVVADPLSDFLRTPSPSHPGHTVNWISFDLACACLDNARQSVK